MVAPYLARLRTARRLLTDSPRWQGTLFGSKRSHPGSHYRLRPNYKTGSHPRKPTAIAWVTPFPLSFLRRLQPPVLLAPAGSVEPKPKVDDDSATCRHCSQASQTPACLHRSFFDFLRNLVLCCGSALNLMPCRLATSRCLADIGLIILIEIDPIRFLWEPNPNSRNTCKASSNHTGVRWRCSAIPAIPRRPVRNRLCRGPGNRPEPP